MKKLFTLLFMAVSMGIFAQNANERCGFEYKMSNLDQLHPELVNMRKEAEQKIRSLDKKKLFRNAGVTTTKSGLYTGKIYEIPVVVHVIESNAQQNASLKVSDDDIVKWINNANRMFATTYGGSIYPEGEGIDGGTVLPFKLALAKRTPSCTPTNGIVRYNGSTIDGYDLNGVASGTGGKGAKESDILNKLAPHWPEDSYFNIYIVIGFNGQQNLNSGLMGYASFPTNPSPYYDSFMKVATLRNRDDTTLVHEMGHAFGLYHTFDEIDYLDQTSCPVNNDCSQDGDMVCDTSPSRSMYGMTVPSNAEIDPCTGVNWDGTQYNIMNYTNDERKFTVGQRDRALAMMLSLRYDLLHSTAAQENSSAPVSLLSQNSCSPLKLKYSYDYDFGLQGVTIGSINNFSSAYNKVKNPNFYTDYTKSSCISNAKFTDLSSKDPAVMTFTVSNLYTSPVTYYFAVYIDLNDNGILEESEKVLNNIEVTAPEGIYYGSVDLSLDSSKFASAVKNKYLRMRVIGDISKVGEEAYDMSSACGEVNFGEVEDYAVRFDGALSTTEIKEVISSKIVYSKINNSIQLHDSKNSVFGAYEIFDVAGKMIQKGLTKTNDVKVNRTLNKGVYIINYIENGQRVSKKFIVN